IILPATATAWPYERLRVAILHEMTHIRRLDYLTLLVSELACAVHWLNPLIWRVRRWLEVEQEKACDVDVLSGGLSAVDYAGHLVDIARAVHGQRQEWRGV